MSLLTARRKRKKLNALGAFQEVFYSFTAIPSVFILR